MDRKRLRKRRLINKDSADEREGFNEHTRQSCKCQCLDNRERNAQEVEYGHAEEINLFNDNSNEHCSSRDAQEVEYVHAENINLFNDNSNEHYSSRESISSVEDISISGERQESVSDQGPLEVQDISGEEDDPESDEHILSSESDILVTESDNEEHEEIEQIKTWAVECKVPDYTIDRLLAILRRRILPELPKSSKTLLNTATYNIRPLKSCNGDDGESVNEELHNRDIFLEFNRRAIVKSTATLYNRHAS